MGRDRPSPRKIVMIFAASGEMAQALISMDPHFSASLASAFARCLIGRRGPA